MLQHEVCFTLPGGCCSFQGSQTLQGFDFTCTPLFSVSSFYAVCFWHSSPSLGSSSHLPTCSSSCHTIKCKRNLCPVTGPPHMFFGSSSPLRACLLIPVWLQPWGSMVGQHCPVSHACTGKSNSIYQLWQYSLYEQGALFPFPPSWPHLPISCTNKGKPYSLHCHLDKLVNLCSGSTA